MLGYINKNNIHCIEPIQSHLLYTTSDICETNKYCNYYSLFIDSSNILKGVIYNRQFTFIMYISNEITIDDIIYPVFDKSYEIFINIFDLNNNKISFVINTDEKILIGKIYKLTYSFMGVNMSPNMFCNIRGYINDYLQHGCNVKDYILDIIIE